MSNVPLNLWSDEIARATSIAELRHIREGLHEDFERELLLSHSLDWNRLLNSVHDRLIVAAVGLAIQQMEQLGLGKPPKAYTYILFGSGGRREQTLWSDQDNGIVYEDPSEHETVAVGEYFATFSQIIQLMLIELGYPPCTGGVICTNEKWCQPVSGYRAMIDEWLAEPGWEHIRYMLVMCDGRPLYGDPTLLASLKSYLFEYLHQHPIMFEHMLHNTLHHKISLGVFGQLIKERYGEDAGGVDIKYGAYIPIVNGIRLLAAEAGISETSTEGRIIGLVEKHFVDEEIAHDWLEAVSIALKLRSLTPFQIEDGQYTTRGILSAEALTKERITELKLCLRIANDLQKYVKKSVHKELERD